MQRYLATAALLTLAACGTPQQQCIAIVTRDLQTVDKLIAETQANLDRGYTYVNVTGTMPQFVDCTPNATDKHPHPRPRNCLVDVAHTYSRAAAIDLNAEAAKLASLKAKRVQLDAAAPPAIAGCQRQYPE
ncbi:MAG: hypothetical protein ABI832_15155 [bacterium]